MGFYKVKLASIYKISIGEEYYIGMSVDTFSRFNSHYTDLKLNKHSSIKLQEKFNQNSLNDFKFEIIEYISKTQFKQETKLKGKALDNKFRTYLLSRERYHMSTYSINYCLNKDNKYFK